MGYIGVVYIAFLCFLRMRVHIFSYEAGRGGEAGSGRRRGRDRTGRSRHSCLATPAGPPALSLPHPAPPRLTPLAAETRANVVSEINRQRDGGGPKCVQEERVNERDAKSPALHSARCWMATLTTLTRAPVATSTHAFDAQGGPGSALRAPLASPPSPSSR